MQTAKGQGEIIVGFTVNLYCTAVAHQRAGIWFGKHHMRVALGIAGSSLVPSHVALALVAVVVVGINATFCDRRTFQCCYIFVDVCCFTALISLYLLVVGIVPCIDAHIGVIGFLQEDVCSILTALLSYRLSRGAVVVIVSIVLRGTVGEVEFLGARGAVAVLIGDGEFAWSRNSEGCAAAGSRREYFIVVIFYGICIRIRTVGDGYHSLVDEETALRSKVES